MSEKDDFELANRAFGLFTLAEKQMALERFAHLRCPSVLDRFFDAVHFVIIKEPKPAPDGEKV